MAKVRADIDNSKLVRDLTVYMAEKVLRPATIDFVAEFKDDIIELFLESLKKGKTWKALQKDGGNETTDLVAHLGLSNPHDELDSLEEFIRTHMTVRTSRRALVGIEVGLSAAAGEEILSEEWASYISEKSGESIDWLSWLLIGGGENDSYSIFFFSGDDDFDELPSGPLSSRTGRAIMINEGDWTLEPTLSALGTSPPNSNFILEAFEDGKLAQKLRSLYNKELVPIIRRGQGGKGKR